MTNRFDPDEFNATNMRIALNAIFPETTYGAIPVVDHYDALVEYLQLHDGALAEASETPRRLRHPSAISLSSRNPRNATTSSTEPNAQSY